MKSVPLITEREFERQVTLTLPLLPPSKNAWSGRHWSVRHKQGQLLKEEIWAAFIAAYRIPPTRLFCFGNPVVVSVEFHFRDHRRRDLQNYCHPGLFDALKNLGIIVDDSAEWMSLELSSVIDGTTQTVIRIRECGGSWTATASSGGKDAIPGSENAR